MSEEDDDDDDEDGDDEGDDEVDKGDGEDGVMMRDDDG